MLRGKKIPSVNVQEIKATDWPIEEERELWADICRKDFWWFFMIAWGAQFYMDANPHERWVSEKVHRPVCRWFQERVEIWEDRRNRGEKIRTKVALIIPRSFGKTVMATKAGSLWAHVRNPDLASYIGSEVLTKAIDFLRPIKSVLEGNDHYGWFAWLYGTWFSPERIWTHGSVVHAARKMVSRSEASFDTWGVDGGITGAHPDWGVFDDPLSEEKLKESGAWLATVNQSMAALRPAFRTDSFFMLSLTRYRDNDVAGTYLKLEGVKSWNGHPILNAEFTPREDGEWDVYFLQAYNPDGSSVLPEVWPLRELKLYEKTKPAEFAAQMMNEPGSGEHMELTAEQVAEMWIKRDELPSNMPFTMHLDTAFKDNKRRGGGDESVIVVFGHDPRGNGDVYFVEGYSSSTWLINDYIDEIIKICQRYKQKGRRIRIITDEKTPGGKAGTWNQLLRSQFHGAGLVMPVFIELTRQGTNKLARMREASGFWVDGHVKLVNDAPGAQQLVNQMVRLGVSAHDDWADAAADVFAKEVYRPMLNIGRKGGDLGAIPRQPGDDALGKWRISNEEAIKIYDKNLREWAVERMSQEDFQ